MVIIRRHLYSPNPWAKTIDCQMNRASYLYTLARTTHTHTNNHTRGEQDLDPIRTGATRFVWGSFEVREMSKSKYSPRERESTVRDLQTVRHSGKDGKGEGTEWYHQNAKGNREKRQGQISITSG
jgi:hypothetical protein